MRLFVVVLSLVNMSLALIAEYTAIGDLFEYYVGSSRVAIIIFTSTVTSIYTAAGGLMVSILTDQSQAILSICLIVVCSLFLIADFRPELQTPLPPNLGANYAGEELKKEREIQNALQQSCLLPSPFRERERRERHILFFKQ